MIAIHLPIAPRFIGFASTGQPKRKGIAKTHARPPAKRIVAPESETAFTGGD
jgi:hypothetical protein